MVQEIEVSAAPTALAYFPLAHDVHNANTARKEVFVGLRNGQVRQLFIDDTSCKAGTTLANTRKRGAVTQVFSGFDLTKNGVEDIVVTRDDGCIEIYDMDQGGDLQQVRARLLAQHLLFLGLCWGICCSVACVEVSTVLCADFRPRGTIDHATSARVMYSFAQAP